MLQVSKIIFIGTALRWKIQQYFDCSHDMKIVLLQLFIIHKRLDQKNLNFQLINSRKYFFFQMMGIYYWWWTVSVQIATRALLTCGFSKMLRTPVTSSLRNLARSVLLNRDRLTEAIWTRQERAYKEKKYELTPC